MKLEVSLFRFDYKSDYLPYYTKNFIKIKNEKRLLDILNNINIDYPFAYENDENFCVVVNGIYTNVSVTIEKLVEKFGKDLIIEPISIRRAHTDLLINEADFEERLKVLSDFIEDEDIENYKANKIYFYASNTINFEYDYIGDPILILAYDLIEKNKKNEIEILEALKDYDCSAQYHTSLKERVLNFDIEVENKIESVRKKLDILKDTKEQNFNLEKTNNIDFNVFKEDCEIKHDFSDFNLAYYKGLKEDKQTLELLNKLNANIIDTPSMKYDLTLNTFHLTSTFTLKIASTIMLDAFDKSADLLIVDDENIFKLFDSNRKELSQVAGREVIIPVIHKNELQKLACGDHEVVKQTLSKHVIDPEII